MKALSVILALLLCGCMTEREYQLRKSDMKAKQAWPSTYQPLLIKGPLTLDKDSELVITVPNMPYPHTPIPDGQAYQLKAITIGAASASAITGGYFIKRAAGNTTHTTINNNGGTAAP